MTKGRRLRSGPQYTNDSFSLCFFVARTRLLDPSGAEVSGLIRLAITGEVNNYGGARLRGPHSSQLIFGDQLEVKTDSAFLTELTESEVAVGPESAR